jgi:hypothetical protein
MNKVAEWHAEITNCDEKRNIASLFCTRETARILEDACLTMREINSRVHKGAPPTSDEPLNAMHRDLNEVMIVVRKELGLLEMRS